MVYDGQGGFQGIIVFDFLELFGIYVASEAGVNIHASGGRDGVGWCGDSMVLTDWLT